MAQSLSEMLHFKHIVIVAHRTQTNGIVERRNQEIMKHLRALVMEKRIKEEWSSALPLVQRIMNYSIDGSIGTQPAKVIFGDLATSDIAMDLPAKMDGRPVLEYLVKLRDMQAALIKATSKHLDEQWEERNTDGAVRVHKDPPFVVGQYVLLQYPNIAPNKLAGLYRGPLVITAIERPNLIKIKDLVTNR